MMTVTTALRMAVKLLVSEKRHKKQFFDMYQKGFESEKPGHDNYLKICEAISIIQNLIEQQEK